MEKEKASDKFVQDTATNLKNAYNKLHEAQGIFNILKLSPYVVKEAEALNRLFGKAGLDKKDFAMRIMAEFLPKPKWMPRFVFRMLLSMGIEWALRSLKKFQSKKAPGS
jgi:hypothetical protein